MGKLCHQGERGCLRREHRWMASPPWVQIVTPDQIVNGQVDTSVPPTGSGTQWGTSIAAPA